MIQIAAKLIAVGDTKVINPASNVLTGFVKLIAHANAPVTVSEFPYSLLKFQQRFRMPFDLTILKRETQEFAFAGLNHLAFLTVNNPF